MWSIFCRIPETCSPPSPCSVWAEQKTLSTTLRYGLSTYIFLSVCSFCVCPSPVVKFSNSRASVLILQFKQSLYGEKSHRRGTGKVKHGHIPSKHKMSISELQFLLFFYSYEQWSLPFLHIFTTGQWIQLPSSWFLFSRFYRILSIIFVTKKQTLKW